MPSPSASADKRALFSPSVSSSTATAVIATTITTTTTTTTTTSETQTRTQTQTDTETTPLPSASTASFSSSSSSSASASVSAWTRRLELPSRPLFANAQSWTATSTDFPDPIAARNGRVTTDSLQDRHAHAAQAMAGRRSSYPFSSSSSPTADPTSPKVLALRNTTAAAAAAAVVVHDDGLPSPLATSASASANGLVQAEQLSVAHAPSSSRQQLNEYREKLTRDLEQRELSARGLHPGYPDKARVSPILEEDALNSPLSTPSFPTASTESANTVRGVMTPAPVASTPSYPFPTMALPLVGFAPSHASQSVPHLHSAGSRISQSMVSGYRGVLDRVLSETSTPASTFTFHPGGTPQPESFEFPTPNLYDLSLMLSAEPGLDAWWNAVVQIMREVYKAERVTLAVPADTTDIENVPWGQKATYNEHREDDFSLGYLAKESTTTQGCENQAPNNSASPGDRTTPNPPKRPGLPSRHSFTTYEENKERSQEGAVTTPRRPSHLTRSKTQFPSIQTAAELASDHTHLNKNTLEQHDHLEEEQAQHIPSWEAPFTTNQEGQGRVLPVLQALDFEADPLIDHTGVRRVLERGRAVALTRTYPYLMTNPTNPLDNQSAPKTAGGDSSKKPKKLRSDSITKLSSIFAGPTGPRGLVRSKVHFGDKPLEDDGPRPPTPKYEEYEQAPPSPWSQSPAPSPAVRPDPKENPFFTDAMVDEDSFNPGPAPPDYTAMHPPEAIGVDHSWTVLHIPLTHVLLSKSSRPFKLNAAAMQQRSRPRSSESISDRNQPADVGTHSPENHKKDKPAPLAILSILSPIIPYPSSLRHSLEHLAPHLATSFSLCRHHSNLETELAGLKRRRPPTAGFGAVSAYGTDENALQQSLAGSITSPSDYSGLSKSATGSPTGTPGWDSGSLAYLIDRRQPAASPAAGSQNSGGYFSNKQTRQESLGTGCQISRTGSKENSPSERRLSRLSSANAPQAAAEGDDSVDKSSRNSDELSSRDAHLAGSLEGSVDSADHKLVDKQTEAPKPEQGQPRRGHTLLHSYGADFASTFQSLPPSSSLLSRPMATSTVPGPHRGGSYTAASAADMPPPSDRLKGLILDSLPAHVFVALPQTGEIVWVNSRYFSYRGQTVADLSADPWGSIHPEERDDYLKAWSHSLRTGEQFSSTVRIKRFDGAYRWFYARAVASKDKRGVIMQFLGSYLDIHDQRMAEIKAARQQEVEASEAKHRLLANLIPQIIFTATEDEGVTFANEQWLSYTGQSFDDALRLGFMDFVHPEDLAKCRIPVTQQSTTLLSRKRESELKGTGSPGSSDETTPTDAAKDQTNQRADSQGQQRILRRQDSSSSSSGYELANADLAELARKGVIKVATDANGRLSYTTEVRLRSKTGEYRWHLVRCVEIDTIDFGSGASSYFGSATDINDHKLLEAKLKEAMETKSRFLSNMSHEIRTPLIGISGMVSFLQDTTLNEEQRDYTNTIQTSANSLIMIINDILDLSKVDAGMMKLKYEWFHTRSLIEDVNELVSTMAIAKRLELNYLVDADVPAWVKGDKVRIRQVLLNVIGNAIKFTAEGEVFSRCRVYVGDGPALDEREIMLEFTITDTGRGFSEEEKALIFKPFSQIDGSSTRQHGGSGLGLVISKQLVELHGGQMEGTAVVGKGSTFTFTARFTLPTAEDRPNLPGSPGSTATPAPPAQQVGGAESVPQMMKPLPPPKRSTSEAVPVVIERDSPGVASTGSSEQSVHSGRSLVTDRSSVTSVNTGLARFSEAAKASGQDLSQMKLEMPSDRGSPGPSPSADKADRPSSPERFRPPVYSILIICPQYHSREATTQHIEMTLPKDVPHQITAVGTVAEAEQFIGGDDPVRFTHIVINLNSAEAVIDVMDQITRSQKMDATTIVILSDSVQRQAVVRFAAGTQYERLLSDNLVTFIYKPVKPSRFAVIFDPDKVRDLSTDWNRSTAQQMVESQKASYMEIERRMGNRGMRVLLVEDNLINQKVLTKYLEKIGVSVDVAVDGVDCTDQVLSKPHGYYSLILCDLHMPRKDGYQACREIRGWEKTYNSPKMPIIALSANVMSDVQDKCFEAGFSDYVTKPVDFIDLSRAMSRFFKHD